MLVVVGVGDALAINHLGGAVGGGTLGTIELVGPGAGRHLERRVECGRSQSPVQVVSVGVGRLAVRARHGALQQPS